MIIDCISDLHGHYPELPGGDLLIVSGDLTSCDKTSQYIDFMTWLEKQEYKKKIVIAGNHDMNIPEVLFDNSDHFSYLCDSGISFEGLNIWGTPWTKSFDGINPKTTAFTLNFDEYLALQWKLIPEDTDILITHCPPWGIFDKVPGKNIGSFKESGSISLRNKALTLLNLQLHVFGHIHEHGGKVLDTGICKFVNASHVNEKYKPVNGFVRIEL